MKNNLITLYHPSTLNDMVLDQSIKDLIQKNLDKNTIFNMTLTGHQGIGKTTLANIITKSLDVDSLFISCSYENSVDIIRTKVKEFCDTVAFSENGKLVILDEADNLTKGNTTAQEALRNIIVENINDTRFILTCNYIDRILGPIQDRCTPIKLKFSVKEIAKHVMKILKEEEIQFDNNTIQEFINVVIKPKYPSIRNILNNLEFWCIDGKLVNKGVSDDAEFDEVIKTILKGLEKGSPEQIRQYYIQNEDKFSNDYEVLAGELFNNINDGRKQLIIAEQIFKMGRVLDKEIQFYSMVLQLSK